MNFLYRLRIAKKDSGLTTEEISVKSGIPIGTLNKIFNGTTKEPKFPTILALSETLDCSLEFLAFGHSLPNIPTHNCEPNNLSEMSHPENVDSPAEHSLIQRYNQLPLSERKIIDEIVDAMIIKNQIQNEKK